MRIAITGANSFIGKKLTEKAVSQGDQVIMIMRSGHETEAFPPSAQKLYLNFADYGQLGSLIGNCDCFVHLAWNGTRGASRMDVQMQAESLQYSVLAVESMLNSGCKRIITAGSQAEYGPHTEIITESSACVPNTEYGKQKLAFYQKVEELCRKAGAEYREPRFFSLYGPDDYEGTMIISMLGHMLNDRPCDLTESIQSWDFLYLDDAVEALYGLCTKDIPNGVYNFGSGDMRQLRDFVLEMASLTETKSELRFGAVPYPETGMVSLWPDITKLQKALDWKPDVTFAEGIKKIIAKN